jgi:hypothetical protein
MSMDTSRLRSRRALLGAGLGAAAAAAAAALPAAARTRPELDPVYLEVDATTNGVGTTELHGGTLKVNRTHGRSIDAVSGDGTAVHADGGNGFGVYAVAAGGFALSTHGRLDLSTAGVASIPAGATSKLVYGGVDITTNSFVLLTPALDIGSRRLWWSKDTVGNSFTIHMSSSRSTITKVSWLLLG